MYTTQGRVYRGISKKTRAVGEVQLLLVGHGKVEEILGLLPYLFGHLKTDRRIDNVEYAIITNCVKNSIQNMLPAARILHLGQINDRDGNGVRHDKNEPHEVDLMGLLEERLLGLRKLKNRSFLRFFHIC